MGASNWYGVVGFNCKQEWGALYWRWRRTFSCELGYEWPQADDSEQMWQWGQRQQRQAYLNHDKGKQFWIMLRRNPSSLSSLSHPLHLICYILLPSLFSFPTISPPSLSLSHKYEIRMMKYNSRIYECVNGKVLLAGCPSWFNVQKQFTFNVSWLFLFFWKA